MALYDATGGPIWTNSTVLERFGGLVYLSLGGNALTRLVPGRLSGLVDLRLLDLGAKIAAVNTRIDNILLADRPPTAAFLKPGDR